VNPLAHLHAPPSDICALFFVIFVLFAYIVVQLTHDQLEKPKTQETKREVDETMVDPEDHEVAEDEQVDELAGYFNGTPPKIIITTSSNVTTVKFA
jgi:hypothetical protein